MASTLEKYRAGKLISLDELKLRVLGSSDQASRDESADYRLTVSQSYAKT
jgi:hypothetical protein